MRKYTLVEHFSELKRRIMTLGAVFVLIFVLCYYISDILYEIILSPLVDVIGYRGRKIIYTGPAEAFLSYIKISAFTAFLIMLPICCYQVYAFISPGLYLYEKKRIAGILALSPLLFYLGSFFMFFGVMPQAWSFFVTYEKIDIGIPLVLEARISEYLSLVIQLTLAFGTAFQLPVVTIILSLLGIVTARSLKRKRRLAIVIIFIVAAILTPPDIFSQIALAIPLLLLYEFSILLCHLSEKKGSKNAGY